MGRSPFHRRLSPHDALLSQLNDLGENLPLGGGPDPAFRARLRETLMSESLPAVPARPARRPERRRLRWLSPLLSAGLAVAMTMSVVVTYRAVPGDVLYPLKRAAEGALIELNPDKAGGALDAAGKRAEELEALLDAGGGGPHVGATLQEMEESTRSAIERMDRAVPRDQSKINKFVEEQHEKVDPMLERLNDVDQRQASGYLDYIDGLRLPTG
ncbi:DUF5667 domain-containing protein [Nonomuraea sp. NPDC059194]|uniref:DUF5667 domain-containing protein n=1 Tax=Nonomuraea sp. NPDC059194 TaxID=3346764 RepID=UPI00369E03EE